MFVEIRLAMYSSTSGGRVQALLDRLLPQDGDPGLKLGRLDVGEQAPLEPAAQPVLQGDQPLGRPVGLEMTICLLALCRVLKVWKNSSCVPSLFSRNWMSSTSRTSTSRYRLRKPSCLPSRIMLMNSLVNSSELTYLTLRPVVERLRVVADGMQQVRLAQAGVAVDEQRVVGLGGRLGDRDGGGVREPVAAADDEGLERVLRVQPGRGRARRLVLLLPAVPRAAPAVPAAGTGRMSSGLGRAGLRLLRRQRVLLGRQLLVPWGSRGRAGRPDSW